MQERDAALCSSFQNRCFRLLIMTTIHTVRDFINTFSQLEESEDGEV